MPSVGGLLTTCGLRATGMPSVDAEGREHPLHGRVSAIPAANVTTALEEDGRGGVRLVITGDMTEWGLGEEALVLHRRLAITVSQPLLEVHDVVVNAGARAQTVMFRHHFNLGHPLVDDGTLLAGDFTYWGARGERTPRRRPSRQFPRSLALATRPQDEEVDYYRPMTPGVNALRVTGQDGPMLEFGIDGEQWPWLIVWRDATPGRNVLGVEPSMSRNEGRGRAEEDGEVLVLAPGERRTFTTTLRCAPLVEGAW